MKQAAAKFWNRTAYRVCASVLAIATKILFRSRFTGRENIPQGGAIIVARHLSFWDIPLVAVALQVRRQVTFVARRTLNDDHPVLRPFINSFAIAVDRENFSLTDFKNVMKALKANKLVAIFPEGTIQQTGKVFPGVIRFAEQSGRDFLPLRLESRKGNYPPTYPFGFPAMTMKIGRPFSVRDLEFDLNGQESKEARYERLSELLMERIDNV